MSKKELEQRQHQNRELTDNSEIIFDSNGKPISWKTDVNLSSIAKQTRNCQFKVQFYNHAKVKVDKKTELIQRTKPEDLEIVPRNKKAKQLMMEKQKT
jgi:hypothetical protein